MELEYNELHRAEVQSKYMNETLKTPFREGSTSHFPKHTMKYVRWLEDQIKLLK